MALRIKTSIHRLHAGGFGLRVESGDEETYFFFNEHGLLGDGCTWHAVVDALVRTTMSRSRYKLEFLSEAGGLLITCNDRRLLERVKSVIRQAIRSEDTIVRAIKNADPGLLE